MDADDRQPETSSASGIAKKLDFEAIENWVPGWTDAPAIGELAADDPNNYPKRKSTISFLMIKTTR